MQQIPYVWVVQIFLANLSCVALVNKITSCSKLNLYEEVSSVDVVSVLLAIYCSLEAVDHSSKVAQFHSGRLTVLLSLPRCVTLFSRFVT